MSATAGNATTAARPDAPVHAAWRRLPLPAETTPRLLVVVDTEEEFDWSAPFDRGQTGVEAMRDVGRFQELFDAHAIVPTYVVDWPVATQETGARLLREYHEHGRATIGAHLHPWVSPPHEEEVNATNSYPGNLPRELERAKLARLTDAIAESFGERPTVYKAGRYGLGPNTPELLRELGYAVDLSPCAAFDLRADGGPDWSGVAPDPLAYDAEGALVGLPTTGAFVGWLAGAGAGPHAAAHRAPWIHLRLPGILSRLGALERLMLSPEGYSFAHMRRLTEALLARGTRVFSFSLHSPSARPGCTPYVRSEADLQDFLATCRQYFDWFLSGVGAAATPHEIAHLLLPRDPPAST